MARNVQISILRGLESNLPALGDGEFFLATDTGQLYVGLGGINYKIGAPVMAAVTIQGNANPTRYIEPNADGSIVAEAPGGAALALEGTDNTGFAQPTGGGGGIRGWLSAIYNALWTVSSPKGTPATTVLSVQEPKDVGRTKVVLTLTKVAAIASEALVTLTIKKGDATTTTGTSYTVTAGKTLRIQSLFLGITSTNTTLWNAAIRVREGASGGGSVSATSDIIAELEAGVTAGAAGQSDQIGMHFPDGVEITGGQIIGISELASTASGVVTVALNGFEY